MDTNEFIHDTVNRLAPSILKLGCYGELLKKEKESKKKPRKKVRQPPKYV